MQEAAPVEHFLRIYDQSAPPPPLEAGGGVVGAGGWEQLRLPGAGECAALKRWSKPCSLHRHVALWLRHTIWKTASWLRV